MKLFNKAALIIIIFFVYSTVYSGEVYDRVIATVNETPVIESEVQTKFDLLLSQKKIPVKKQPEEKSRLLDKFIEIAIVEQTAKHESIIVSPEKVDNQIKKIMERMDIKSVEALKKEIEKTENMSFEDYKEELRKQLITEQVMSIAIGITPPSVKEAEDWYKNNKGKMGYEVNIQHIMVRLTNESFSEEKRVNKITNDLFDRIKKGQSFESTAMEFSEDADSRKSGGNMGWIVLANLAKKDIILANNIYNNFVMHKNKYSIVKSSNGYHIVKLNGIRPTSFEAVKEDIFNLLYQKRVAEQFKKWVSQKKQESEIKIYMADYIKEKVNT